MEKMKQEQEQRMRMWCCCFTMGSQEKPYWEGIISRETWRVSHEEIRRMNLECRYKGTAVNAGGMFSGRAKWNETKVEQEEWEEMISRLGQARRCRWAFINPLMSGTHSKLAFAGHTVSMVTSQFLQHSHKQYTNEWVMAVFQWNYKNWQWTEFALGL